MIPRVCLLVISCLCALTQSFPLTDSSDSVVIDYKTDSHSRFEEGQPGKGVRGSYSWVNDDKIYQVDYTADENGYKPRLTIKSNSKSESTFNTVVQQDKVQAEPGLQKEAEDVQSAKEVDADAIVIDVPVAVDPIVQKDSVPVQPMSQPEADKVNLGNLIVTHEVVANAPAESQPVAIQENIKAELPSETGNSKPSKIVVADETDVNIPVVSDPIVQQEGSPDKPVSDTDEVKPDKLIVAQEIVLDVPAQSVAKEENIQSQTTSLDAPTEVEPDQPVVDENIAANIPVESIADVQSAQGDSNQDVTLSQNDAQEMILEIDPSMFMPSVFDTPSVENQSKDEIYTDDAVIIDAAVDPLATGVLDNIDQWDQVKSQDEASAYLNAMLTEYANQMYGNAQPQDEIEENRQPEIREKVRQPEPFYYEEESETEDSAFDYQRGTMGNSNDDAYSNSFDLLYNSFLHHLQVAKEYRARSKVDDDVHDQGEASQDLQAAFRLLVDVAETFTQDLPISEKEIVKIEPRSGSNHYATEDSLLEELYYQQWLAAQKQQIYYVVYPEEDDYYRKID